jgi:HPt (histidine-containing phosphotransfer) domain-containing protein
MSSASASLSRVARVARALVEPAPRFTDVGERRRIRLMATLQLVDIVQLSLGGIATALTDSGESAIRIPMVLLACVPCTIFMYLLTRSRHAWVGIYAHVVMGMAITPALVLADPTQPDVFVFFAYMLPHIMVANVATSALTTLFAGAGGLTAMIVLAKAFGPPGWADDIRHGVIFLTVGLSLVVVFGIHRDRLEADRLAELRARNEELESLRRTLELRVEERTQELMRRNTEMGLVLDNVAEGLFAIDRAGAFSSDASAAFTAWFGCPTRGESFISFLGRHAPEYVPAAQMAWEQVADDVLPLELALAQVPKRLVMGDRQYDLAFEPIGGEEGKLLVVVSDVTGAVEHEKVLRERREALALFENILADRTHFVASFEELSALVARVLDPAVERPTLLRDLHTLKGTALMLGIESIGAICHALESRLAEEEGLPNTAERATLETGWATLKSEADRLLGQRKHTLELTPEQYRSLERAVREARPYDDLLRMVVDFKLEPVGPRLRNFADQTLRIAARLGKEVVVEIQNDDELRVDGPKWAPLWAAVVHAVRNAIDHGIESPSERRAAGKPERGCVVFRALRTADEITIEVRDDGRGINWDMIRKQAEARGADVHGVALEASLFAGGLSTAGEVTDLSGRGLGMSALSAAVCQLGGNLRLDSAMGVGTRIRMVFPQSSVGRMGLDPLGAK